MAFPTRPHTQCAQLAVLQMMPPGLGGGLCFGGFNLAVKTKAMHVFNFLMACGGGGGRQAAWAAAEPTSSF